MSRFIFKSYGYSQTERTASFSYAFDDGRSFSETVSFQPGGDCDKEVLGRALFLAFVIIGTSYYKTFPTTEVELPFPMDEWQARFFNSVYQEGLSQFAFENGLTRSDLVHFKPTSPVKKADDGYCGSGILVLESGGKDSLLSASMLTKKSVDFSPLYISSGQQHPAVLDRMGSGLIIGTRRIDIDALNKASFDGGLNGHVPITYIVQSLAVIQAVLLGKNCILTSIAHEGEEPHEHIGDLDVTHQWSKTWAAEQAFSEYVTRYISSNISIGSPLRSYSELKVAQLFVENCWEKYGHEFSSCNISNYKQGADNSTLNWCGRCAKCANSYLLFAPFLPAKDLKDLFGGQDLFEKPELENIFKGLLGIDGHMKPFECVGEIDELRAAYRLSQSKSGYGKLPFDVPASGFDFEKTYPAQEWALGMVQ